MRASSLLDDLEPQRQTPVAAGCFLRKATRIVRAHKPIATCIPHRRV